MSRTWIATLAAIWLVDIGSAVFLVRVIDGPRANEVPGAPPLTAEVFFAPETEQPVVNATSAPVLQMPEVTIVASPGGAAEMQGTDDLIIGPATVTHPEAKQPPPPRPR
jgi:hypothetical protein